MSVRSRKVDDTAAREIDAFAKRLLTLTRGRRIPRAWTHRLLRALLPERMKPGKKPDLDRYASIVAALCVLGDEARSRTRTNSLTAHYRKIGLRHNVSYKTVERIHEDYRAFLKEPSALESDKQRAVIEGMAEAINVTP